MGRPKLKTLDQLIVNENTEVREKELKALFPDIYGSGVTPWGARNFDFSRVPDHIALPLRIKWTAEDMAKDAFERPPRQSNQIPEEFLSFILGVQKEMSNKGTVDREGFEKLLKDPNVGPLIESVLEQAKEKESDRGEEKLGEIVPPTGGNAGVPKTKGE